MRWNAGDGKVDEYDGHWENGRMHGQGVYKYYDGTRYQGQFQDNLRQGYGILTFTDGSLYEGGWSEDVPEGEGRVIYSNGQIVNTTFKAGQQSMEHLETLMKEAAPPPPPAGMDFVPGDKPQAPASSSTAPAILNDSRPPLPPPEPYSMVADRPDMSLPISEGDSLARLPVLALTNIPPPPPLGTTAPLPALKAPGPAGAVASSPLGALPLGASPPGASPLGASPVRELPVGMLSLGAAPRPQA
ncbi:Als2 [Symbiodinium sp. KB8]|nr:Als2 [Symbiodinium sp. KB8]